MAEAFYRDKSISIGELPHLAAVGGSLVTRTTSRLAFKQKGRALVTQDLLGEIGAAFVETFEEGEKGWGGKM
jgi:ATP-dependent NAD(P)H-hydrate dehydratase